MENDVELNPEFIEAYNRVMTSLDVLIKSSHKSGQETSEDDS